MQTTDHPQFDAFKRHLLSESQTQWTKNLKIMKWKGHWIWSYIVSSLEKVSATRRLNAFVPTLCFCPTTVLKHCCHREVRTQTRWGERLPSPKLTINIDMGWQARSVHIKTYIAIVWGTEKVGSTHTEYSRCDALGDSAKKQGYISLVM